MDNQFSDGLGGLPAEAVPADERAGLSDMLERDLDRRALAVNAQDGRAWAAVRGREDWEGFVRPRVAALQRSLGTFPEAAPLEVSVNGAVEGEGYRIECLVFESRRDLPVTANLYLPNPRRQRMPGLLLVHSHHNPKTQGELQDMGVLWARQGCMVLVMDQLGYGERRQHGPGRRQDYRFRYMSGVQLQLIGDSLMGWMVWDIRRGVDLLLSREGIDPQRILLMGSVAGGGDPAAVAAALDDRVCCAIPFNFGGPQPETGYPLPEGAEDSFNYMGWGGWETTRNLALSARDGFLPWAIVGSLAPRYLVYAHEFAWDRERDPVWKRLQAVFGLCGASSHLGFAHGFGLLTGQPPQASHCNNVGPAHRKMIYPLLERWFGISAPQTEVEERREEADLACLAPGTTPPPLHDLWTQIGMARAAAFRATLAGLSPEARRQRLRGAWTALLGQVEPAAPPELTRRDEEAVGGVRVERIVLQVEPGIAVPLLLLHRGAAAAPAVVGLSQEGKAGFLRQRREQIAGFLARGMAVCLPDVRGTGETSPGPSRRPMSRSTTMASTELMLGQALLGSRLRDLRSVLRYLRTRKDLAPRFALWGESFAPANPAGIPDPVVDPLSDSDPMPVPSEPLGGLLALFGALFESDVRALSARGMLSGYGAALRDRFCYLPYDAVVPGAMTAGDLVDVAAALAPRPQRLEGLVDGRNCLVAAAQAAAAFAPAAREYGKATDRFALLPDREGDVVDWLVTGVTVS